jgi:protein-L-isoaspartate(D-aspartate) O-methyltransferase
VRLEEAKARLFRQLAWEIRDHRVVDAMRRVPRERFVPESQHEYAYDDRPLSIGYGQTISQPYIVALMLQALELQQTNKVLEVGAGSGYVTAILAELAGKIVGVEIVPELADYAAATVVELGYTNVDIQLVSRSTLGYLPEAPYDAILVSAGSPSVPQLLLGQLKWGGRLVIPVGSRWQQDLLKITREPEGDVVENLGACYFVPLLGDDAWKS